MSTINRENVHDFDVFFQSIEKDVRNAISENPNLNEYVINVGKYGIVSLSILKAPLYFDERFNGYVVINDTHPFIESNCNVQDHVQVEDITYESFNKEKNECIYGFDTHHIYNKIPNDMTPLVYTMERELRFVQNFIIPVAKKFGQEFVIKPLPQNIFNDW